MTTDHQSGEIVQVSNELEFCLDGITADTLLGSARGRELPLLHEVNQEDVVELNVSLTENVAELNERMADLVQQTRVLARDLGGRLYGGSSLLKDTDNVRIARYRTTSLSESCAHGLLDITSQQMVMGVQGEAFGMMLYNYLREISPVLLALSASSPYRFCNGLLANTRQQSRRIEQYRRICQFFPEGMSTMPRLLSLEEYTAALQKVSDEVKVYLRDGRLDCNREELYKNRRDQGGPYAQFTLLKPHQVYWMVRVRPDHKNELSDFSLELRVCDIPTTIQRMQMLNSYVLGIAYFMAEEKCSSYHNLPKNLPRLVAEESVALSIAGQRGLSGKIGNIIFDEIAGDLLSVAQQGLRRRGFHAEERQMTALFETVLKQGNDAELLRRQEPRTVEEAKAYLVERLENGE